MKNYPAYQFKTLERISAAQAALLNRVSAVLPQSEALQQILQGIAESLLTYDICNWENLEIGLLVKPVGGIGTPQFHRIPKPEVSIGRTNDNDIALKSPLVSKKHADIKFRGTDFFLRDLKSNNGTFLNDVRISPGSDVMLKNDDVIKVEPFEIVVGLASEVTKHPLDIRLHSAGSAQKPVCKGKIAVFCRIQPQEAMAALLIDEQVALWIVRKIITGHREAPETPWTEIEEGLLAYLTTKLLSRTNPLLKEVNLVFDRIEKEESAIETFFSGPLVESTFSAKAERGMIYASLYFPDSLLPIVATRAHDPGYNLPRLTTTAFAFSIEIGESILSSDQIPQLEEGDIILLDRTSVTLDGTLPKGKVELRCKRWPRGLITGTLGCDTKGTSSITVEAIYQEGMKRMAEASKKQEPQKQDTSGEALGGIEVPVTVEFARMNFSLEEIASFREGQIIEFEKGQPEVVDLAVEGKVIANGKLVDIEGKLGIRIVKIVKSK
jgi:type III secretion system YscQ/HrcQ family protein